MIEIGLTEIIVSALGMAGLVLAAWVTARRQSADTLEQMAESKLRLLIEQQRVEIDRQAATIDRLRRRLREQDPHDPDA